MPRGKVKINEMEFVITEKVEEIYRKEITSFGTGAHVIVPKDLRGKTAYLVVVEE